MTSSLQAAYQAAVARVAEQYGERVVVVAEVGNMYQLYGDQAVLAHSVAGLNIMSGSSTAGFPVASFGHWCDRFTQQGYLVAEMKQFVRQKKNGTEEFYREIVRIHSPGVPHTLPSNCDNAVCAVVVLDDRPGHVGYATLDSTTGRTQACQFVEPSPAEALGGVLSAALADAPAYTLVVTSDSPAGDAAYEEFGRRVAGTSVLGKRVERRTLHESELRPSHVRDTIRAQSGAAGLMTGCGDPCAALAGRPLAASAYAQLVHFVYRRDDSRLRAMEPPTVLSPHNTLDVAIGGLKQMDIIQENGLLDHLPRCITSAGRRAFRARLTRPSRDPDEIERRLADVDAVRPVHKQVRRTLAEIKDVEALVRRMERPSAFRPPAWAALAESLRALSDICALCHGEPNTAADGLAQAIEEVVDTAASKDAPRTVFRPGLDPGLDEAGERAARLESELSRLLEHLDKCSGACRDRHFKLSEGADGDLDVVVTQRRFEAARHEIRRRAKAGSLSVAGREIPCQLLSLERNLAKKNERVLHHPDLRAALDDVAAARWALREAVDAAHEHHCHALRERLSAGVALCARQLEDIDVAAACAVMAEERGFCRPVVVSGQGAFVEARDLRHPIVEDLDWSHEYVGNDVRLGEGLTGQLIFGINGSGKSCLMKSLGIAVCMAQAGMYVCARSLRLGPFARLFTRIWNNDDINRGESTFGVEMGEMNQILRRGDSMSLVLGDELCSGTERVSATALIVASIRTMHRRGCRFLLATHQHDVVGRVAALPDVGVAHLSVRFDDGVLVYDRVLREGPGETTYGVTVCRALGLPPEFLEEATAELRRAQGVDPECLVSRRRSNYNADVYLGLCEACGVAPAAHTHHRVPQSRADASVKNKSHNLQGLCAACHERHHREEREGRAVPVRVVQTSAGPREVPVDIA